MSQKMECPSCSEVEYQEVGTVEGFDNIVITEYQCGVCNHIGTDTHKAPDPDLERDIDRAYESFIQSDTHSTAYNAFLAGAQHGIDLAINKFKE